MLEENTWISVNSEHPKKTEKVFLIANLLGLCWFLIQCVNCMGKSQFFYNKIRFKKTILILLPKNEEPKADCKPKTNQSTMGI